MAKKDAKLKQGTDEQVVIVPWQQRSATFMLVGVTPFICNCQSEKTRRTLLLPSPRKTEAEKTAKLKHDPLAEYQASSYRSDNPKAPTVIVMKGGAFKSAACDSSVDTEGAIASRMRRLISVPDYYVNIYGIPQLWMTDVRQAGISRTPDIRTRAIIPRWAARVTFTYAHPLITDKEVAALIVNGGMTRGVGDGRVEKGALDFGKFEPTSEKDPRVLSILKEGGYAAQLQALNDPTFYDRESEKLFAWFQDEVVRRGKEGQLISQNGDMPNVELEECLDV